MSSGRFSIPWRREFALNLISVVISIDSMAVRGYVGECKVTSNPLETFGGAGVVEISPYAAAAPFIREEGFEHHLAANLPGSAAAVHETART